MVDATAMSALRLAANLHDLGKADTRFQTCPKNGRRYGPPELLAKSRSISEPSRWKSLCLLAGLPPGFRHEMLSTQIASRQLGSDSPQRDLILHLIASHHGRARPFAPVVIDNMPPDVMTDGIIAQSVAFSVADRLAIPLHQLNSGVPERFWHLTRTHGWWGLLTSAPYKPSAPKPARPH